MDTGPLALVAQQAMTYLQPYWPLIAAKAAEKIGEELPAAIKNLWNTLKEKFNSDAAAQRALERLLSDPENPKIQNMLEGKLLELLEDDGIFAQKVEALATQAAPAAANYQASASGGSAIAQGKGAKAVAQGGVLVEGNVSGDIQTGSSDKQEEPKKTKP